jgi:hypothetical protein
MTEAKQAHAGTVTVRWLVPTRPDGHPTAHIDLVELEIRAAVHQLAETLARLEMAVALEEAPLDDPKAPDAGHILIDDRRLEDWLGARSEVDEAGVHAFHLRGETYAVVPAECIVEAGLLAASYRLDHAPGGRKPCPRTGAAPSGCGRCCGKT